jgi:multiple sugar transport system ATP-binding protein
MARVVIERLTKSFRMSKDRRVDAVKDLGLTIDPGELLVLVGPSGSGKTTTLRLLAGLEEPDSGSISIDGRDVTTLPAKGRDIAMVFQHHALHPHMSVFQNIAFPLTIRKLASAEIDNRVRETAELLELVDCLSRRPAEISGGQRQRVALGRALARRPKLLLLDEPLSNLDAPLRAQMRRLIGQLNRRLPCTMIYVTHDQTEAMMLGTRLAVMKQGVIQQLAEPMQIYRKPSNTFVAGFIGWPPMNLLEGRLVSKGNDVWFEQQQGAKMATSLVVKLGAWDQNLMGRVKDQVLVLGFRPEDLRVASNTGDGWIEGEVTAIERAGATAFVHLTNGMGTVVAAVSPSLDVRLKERRRFELDMPRVHFFDGATRQALAAT